MAWDCMIIDIYFVCEGASRAVNLPVVTILGSMAAAGAVAGYLLYNMFRGRGRGQ